MKYYITAILSVVLLFGGMTLCAQKKKENTDKNAVILPSDVTVELSVLNPPRVNFDKQGGGSLNPNTRWMRILIGYKFNGGRSFAKNSVIRNMRIEVYMRLLPGVFRGNGDIWLTGTQYLASVPCDKYMHLAALYVPPGTLYRFSIGGKIDRSLIKGCEGMVLFYNGDTLLARKFFDSSSSMQRNRMKMILDLFRKLDAVPERKLVNEIWPREYTPWNNLDTFRYDVPRPVFPSPEKKVNVGGDVMESDVEAEKTSGAVRSDGKDSEEPSSDVKVMPETALNGGKTSLKDGK